MSKEYETRMEKEMKARLLKQEARLKSSMEDEFEARRQELEDKLEVKEKHLKETRDRESSLRKGLLDAEEKMKNQKLEMDRQLEDERKKLAESIRRKLDEEFNLRNLEIQQTNEGLKKQVEELKQKLEQGSQQMQGEVIEQEIEKQLGQTFPYDSILPVPPGTKGPDILQHVKTPAGHDCGIIAWEIKRTKDWKEEWIDKLKGELNGHNAEVGIIVSKALPSNVRTFTIKDGIVVGNYESAVPVASLLRTHLIEVARQRSLGASSTETKEQLYRYLTSIQFRQRIEAAVEPILHMREDVESERRVMERQWSKRIKQMERAVHGMAGMYGDLEGIVGKSLPSVKVLSLPEVSEETEDQN